MTRGWPEVMARICIVDRALAGCIGPCQQPLFPEWTAVVVK
jgi:hypothetical protein